MILVLSFNRFGVMKFVTAAGGIIYECSKGVNGGKVEKIGLFIDSPLYMRIKTHFP